MKKIEEALWNDYDSVSNQIDECDISKGEFNILFEERDKIRKELIELHISDQEYEIKTTTIECDNMRDKIHNFINIGTFAISMLTTWYGISKTFKFDQEATVTSTLGRPILNSLIPKMGKR